MLSPDERKHKKLNKQVREHLKEGYSILTSLDKVMKEPDSFQRGKKLALLSNALEMSLDALGHFGLSLEFKTLNRLYKKEYLKD